jgi:hypothetical protein
MEMTRTKPFQQGNLDGLCGVYSLVNSSRIVCGATEEDSNLLFKEIVQFLDESGKFALTCTDGMDVDRMRKIVKYCGPDYYPTVKMPYCNRSVPGLDEFWGYMYDFMQAPHRAIILGLGGRHEHWTVVSNITRSRLFLYDSMKLKQLDRNRCSVQHCDRTRIHLLTPTQAMFISRKD